jgi:hypothetical protein
VKGLKATRAVVQNLYKVMAFKDELWVAELLLPKKKLNRDRVKYNVNRRRGDSVEYIHLNHLEETVTSSLRP